MDNIIGKRILRRRQELGWTQQELAEKMGYKSKSSINKIELGINDVTQRKVVDFAKVLSMSISELMEVKRLDPFEEFKNINFSSSEYEEIRNYIRFILAKRNEA